MLALKSARPIGSWSAFVPLRICRCMLESVGMGIPSACPPARRAAARAAGRGPCREEPGGPVPCLCPLFCPKYWLFFPLMALLEPSLVCIQTITLPYTRISALVRVFVWDEDGCWPQHPSLCPVTLLRLFSSMQPRHCPAKDICTSADLAPQVKPDMLPMLSVCFSTPAILLFGSNLPSSSFQNGA